MVPDMIKTMELGGKMAVHNILEKMSKIPLFYKVKYKIDGKISLVAGSNKEFLKGTGIKIVFI